MRLMLYKVDLKFNDGTTLPITVASAGKEPIYDLVMSRKMLYERPQRGPNPPKLITGLAITDERPTITMGQDVYDEEISWTDIVQEV